jgi:hypothetical protein
MATIQSVQPEELAKLFHQYKEMLAPDFQCKQDASPSWDQTPAHEQRLLIAAARLALDELACSAGEAESARSYFAKPGEAEWGC